jgi:hypothetical protein
MATVTAHEIVNIACAIRYQFVLGSSVRRMRNFECFFFAQYLMGEGVLLCRALDVTMHITVYSDRVSKKVDRTTYSSHLDGPAALVLSLEDSFYL